MSLKVDSLGNLPPLLLEKDQKKLEEKLVALEKRVQGLKAKEFKSADVGSLWEDLVLVEVGCAEKSPLLARVQKLFQEVKQLTEQQEKVLEEERQTIQEVFRVLRDPKALDQDFLNCFHRVDACRDNIPANHPGTKLLQELNDALWDRVCDLRMGPALKEKELPLERLVRLGDLGPSLCWYRCRPSSAELEVEKRLENFVDQLLVKRLKSPDKLRTADLLNIRRDAQLIYQGIRRTDIDSTVNQKFQGARQTYHQLIAKRLEGAAAALEKMQDSKYSAERGRLLSSALQLMDSFYQGVDHSRAGTLGSAGDLQRKIDAERAIYEVDNLKSTGMLSLCEYRELVPLENRGAILLGSLAGSDADSPTYKRLQERMDDLWQTMAKIYPLSRQSIVAVKSSSTLHDLYSSCIRSFSSSSLPGALRPISPLYAGARRRWEPARLQKGRNALASMGAEFLELRLPGGDLLDAVYLSPKSFHSAISKMGGSFRSYQAKNSKGTERHVHAIVFDGKSALGLKELQAFASRWQLELSGYKLSELDGRPAIVPRDFNPEEALDWKVSQESTYEVVDPAPTVIVASGNMGVYEAERWRTFAFLMQGMAVFQANPPSYGLSTGMPSQSSLEKAAEASYQYVKKSQPEDKKILLYGWCMGSTYTAWCAKEHPEVNLVMDQAPPAFTEFNLTERISLASASSILPNWNSPENIRLNKGHKLVMIATEDRLVTRFHTHKVLKAAEEAKGSLSYTEMKGAHGMTWTYDLLAHRSMADFLKHAGLSSSQFYLS